jgi:hypothetical protein
MRVWFLSVLVVSGLSTNAQFRDISWGTSEAEIIELEHVDCDGIYSRDTGGYCSETGIHINRQLTLEDLIVFTAVNFRMADGVLTEGDYYFIDNPRGYKGSFGQAQPQENIAHLKSTCTRLLSLLKEKYGSPEAEVFDDAFMIENWTDNEGPTGVFADVRWDAGATQITLILERNSYLHGPDKVPHDHMELRLKYRSVELGEWGDQWRDDWLEQKKKEREEEERKKRLKGL